MSKANNRGGVVSKPRFRPLSRVARGASMHPWRTPSRTPSVVLAHRSPLWVRYSVWLVVWLAAFVLLFLLRPILTPFVSAAILAYMGSPLVEGLVRRRCPRLVAVLMVMLALSAVVLGVLAILLPLLYQQVEAFLGFIPRISDWLQNQALPFLSDRFGVTWALDAEHLRVFLQNHVSEAKVAAQKLLPSIGQGGRWLLASVANAALIPVVLFYLLRDWPELVAAWRRLIPAPWQARVGALTADIDGVLAEFLRGQLLVMLLMAVFYSVGLWLVGLKFASPVGLLAGGLVFIPYVGMGVGLVLATLAGLLQYGDVMSLWPVWVVFFLGQMLEGMVVTPMVVGDRIGLHPVAVMFALLAFGQWFGFVGVLLALPLAAVLLVGLRHIEAYYLNSHWYHGVDDQR